MANAVKQAFELIKQANFSQIDSVYTINLPTEIVDNTKTIILITDVNTKPDVYGNNHFNALDKEIEVHIFYGINIDYDPETFEVPLLQLFDDNGWQIDEIHQHTYDPDSGQLSVAIYFNKQDLI